MGGTCSTHVRGYKCIHNILVGKTEWKRSRDRTTNRWGGIIRMNLREKGWQMWKGFIWLRMETSGRFL
jgi:hypothetical protein